MKKLEKQLVYLEAARRGVLDAYRALEHIREMNPEYKRLQEKMFDLGQEFGWLLDDCREKDPA